MTTLSAPAKPAAEQNPASMLTAPKKPEQIRLARRSPAYWRVTIDNPLETDRLINDLMGKDVSARFRFIMERAAEVQDLDV